MPVATCSKHGRRAASARHSFAFQAACSTAIVSHQGRSSGRQPSGAPGVGAQASRSSPSPKAR
eukprot:11022495-Lingulodinium_polyedra.AAC.1